MSQLLKAVHLVHSLFYFLLCFAMYRDMKGQIKGLETFGGGAARLHF